MERSGETRFALLIDADNTSAKWADAIFEEIATLGEADVRRIYGDFSGPHLRSWEKKLAGLAVIAHQQFSYTKGKNSSHIALVIDAMDLMHTGRFDGFVLVSSDSDFARLASRLRIIPARAGNTNEARVKAGLEPDHPRAGGEHRPSRAVLRSFLGSSPRGRIRDRLRGPREAPVDALQQ